MSTKIRTVSDYRNSGTVINGSVGRVYGHVDSLTNNFFMNAQKSKPALPHLDHEFDYSCYNLLVSDDDELEQSGCVMIEKSKSLNESTPRELMRLGRLTPDCVAQLKKFPAIIATENHSDRGTDSEHMAYYGYITDVRVQDNGVKVRYQALNEIPQQKLNELESEIGLQFCTAVNELDCPHWAAKNVNIVEVLKANGIFVFKL